MNGKARAFGAFGILACASALVAFTGCTTYVEQPPVPPPPVVYEAPPPPEAPVVVVQAESDFYQPLSPYGQWVVVGSYGNCWVPRRVDRDWRPYCNGHWVRTDAGWYWASDEPWAWATYHYGRWAWTSEYGWVWVPQTQWAPAWVCWREGAGYTGWAPLPPTAHLGPGGVVMMQPMAIPPRAFVFVEERRLLEPVRPSTVIVNQTIVNKTVNITKIRVVNKTVINDGPRTDVIEHVSGQKIRVLPVRELRHKEEAVVAEKPISPAAGLNTVPAVNQGAASQQQKPVTQPRATGRPEKAVAEKPPQAPPSKKQEIKVEDQRAKTQPDQGAALGPAVQRKPENRGRIQGQPTSNIDQRGATAERKASGQDSITPAEKRREQPVQDRARAPARETVKEPPKARGREQDATKDANAVDNGNNQRRNAPRQEEKQQPQQDKPAASSSATP